MIGPRQVGNILYRWGIDVRTILSEKSPVPDFWYGYPKVKSTALDQLVPRKVKVALTAGASTDPGATLKWQNPEGARIIITRLILDITTEATGVATVDAGTDDDGADSSDNLIDGGDVGSAAVVLDNLENGGDNGKMKQALDSGEYITITPSATTAGMVGNALIEYYLA